jgi:hypothetical protein
MHGAIDDEVKVTILDFFANVCPVYITVVRKLAVKREPSSVTLGEIVLPGTKRVRIHEPNPVDIHDIRAQQGAQAMKEHVTLIIGLPSLGNVKNFHPGYTLSLQKSTAALPYIRSYTAFTSFHNPTVSSPQPRLRLRRSKT